MHDCAKERAVSGSIRGRQGFWFTKYDENDSSSYLQVSSMPIGVLLKNYLSERTDIEAVWMFSENQKFFQVSCCVNFGFFSDWTLQDLVNLDVGTRKDTRVFVLPTTAILQQETSNKRESILSLTSMVDANHSSDISANHEECDIQATAADRTFSNRIRKRINESNFKKSGRARLMVHQVVASVRAWSAITLDFVLLICLASLSASPLRPHSLICSPPNWQKTYLIIRGKISSIRIRRCICWSMNLDWDHGRLAKMIFDSDAIYEVILKRYGYYQAIVATDPWKSAVIWSQVEQPRPLTTIYGLIRPSWPYFTVTLRVTWLCITTVFLRIVYDEIRSSTGTKKWLLIIIVDVRCTLLPAYIVYSPKRPITESVCDRKRRVYLRIHDTEKYDCNTEPCNTAKYGRIRSVCWPCTSVYCRLRIS